MAVGLQSEIDVTRCHSRRVGLDVRRQSSMRFTLRSLFLFVACCSILISALLWATREYRRQLGIRRHLQSLGASWVGFTPTETTCQTNVVFGQPISNGLDDYRELGFIEFKGFDVTAESVEKLEALERIERVLFVSCHIQDEDIDPLANVRNLPLLIFWNARISDNSIETIAKVPGLQKVCFKNTAVTASGIRSLKTARPEVEVVWQP